MANIYKARDFYGGTIKTLEKYPNGLRKVVLVNENGECMPPQVINRNGTIIKDNNDEFME